MNENQNNERAKLIDKVNSEIKKSASSRKEALKRQGIARRKIEELLIINSLNKLDR